MNIDLWQLLEPILDVGCGQQAKLVHYLREQGLEVHGIDRSCKSSDNLTQTDWFSFDWKPNYWGTIISNVGFSNHFAHHHLRTDGDFLSYAQTYMRMLQSLQQNGSFYYAPDLPFIEELLPANQFYVTKKPVAGTGFSASRIEKI